ncbi:MAG: hypothetical protein ACHQNT_08885 [Bacteroidia bacterium]
MKIKICFLIIIINSLLNYNVTGQNQTIDFFKDSCCYEYDVNFKKEFHLEIININRNLYKVTSEKKEEDFNIETPAVFSAIKLPAFFTLKSPQSINADLEDRQMSPADAAAASATTDKLNNLLSEIKRIANKIKDAASLNNDYGNLLSDCEKKCKDLEAEIKTKTQLYLGITETDKEKLKKNLSDTLDYYKSKSRDICGEIEPLIKAYNEQAHNIVDEMNSKIESYKQGIKVLKDIKKPTNEQKLQQKALETKLKSAEESLELFKKSLQKSDKEVNANNEAIKAFCKEIEDFFKSNNVFIILSNYSKMNKYNFIFSTPVIKPDKDLVKYTFTIEANSALVCDKPRERTITVELNTKGGWKLDFSTGAFLNSGNIDFLGTPFYYKHINDSVTHIKQVSSDGKLLLSIGGLLHLHRRGTAPVKLGLSGGVSISSDFDDLNFHAGPSFILGNDSRFILTVGVTLRTATLLDSEYKLNTDYQTSLLPESVPTTKAFPKSGGFISISYNLSNLQKKE